MKKHCIMVFVVLYLFFSSCGVTPSNLNMAMLDSLFATDGFDELAKDNPIDKSYSKLNLNGSTEEIIEVNSEFIAHWEQEINFTCEKLLEVLGDKDALSLKESQIAWETYMDYNDTLRKQFFYGNTYEMNQGSLEKVIMNDVRLNETRYRALELKEYLYRLVGSVDFVFME